MTLYERMYEDFIRLVPVQMQLDGEGGHTDALTPGKPLKAAVYTPAGGQRTEAGKQVPFAACTITAPKGTGLEFHDIIKRKSDGAMFRVIGAPICTPAMASFGFEQCQAEPWPERGV